MTGNSTADLAARWVTVSKANQQHASALIPEGRSPDYYEGIIDTCELGVQLSKDPQTVANLGTLAVRAGYCWEKLKTQADEWPEEI